MTTDRKVKAEWVFLAAFGVFAISALVLASLCNPDSHRKSMIPVFAGMSGLLAVLALLAHMGSRAVRKVRAAIASKKKLDEIAKSIS
jgi:hypothetical protein